MYEGNLFLLSWDMHGLETAINVTDIEKQASWATLKNEKVPSLGSVVNAVLIRARANAQRHYEVYTVTMESNITEQDVYKMFDENPQGMADLIRERGHKIYSDRYNDGNSAKIV